MMNLNRMICTGLWLAITAISTAAAEPELVGHWKLEQDVKDSSGQNNHGVNHGVRFTDAGSALFDGIDDYIEVPDAESLRPKNKPFSVAAWVYTEKELDDVLGDIVSKYDPARRKGFNFSIMNYAGVTSAQSNWRNIHFGIDDGRITQPWTDCGRPGTNLMVWALTVYDGNLYAGTFEHGADQAGHVWRWAGEKQWIDCGSPDQANTVSSLAVYDGHLYAGTSRYAASGSALPDSPNNNPGGKVYRYEGGKQWICCGQLQNEQTGQAVTVHSLIVYRGKLYASTMYRDGRGLYEYQGDDKWLYCSNPGRRADALTVYNGHIYNTTWDSGDAKCMVSRSIGDGQWRNTGIMPDTQQTYGFAAYNGRLHVATWPNATVFRLAADDQWINCGRLGQEMETMAMAVYNGKLYAGSLPLAEVYRYEGGSEWTLTGRLDFTPDVKYRRVWSMAVYQGKLFAGTLPSGQVYSFEAGRNVTFDRALKPGWRHLAVVRDTDRLRLYIDGEPAAESTVFDDDMATSNQMPLKIGFGSHDYLNGQVRDLRLYQGALSASRISALFAETRRR